MPVLHVIVERPGQPAISRVLDGDVVVVGRSDKVDITIDDSSVSRRHVRLFQQDDSWFVEDLGSRNGTDLNQQRLSQACRVRPGDVIRIGSTALRVQDRSESPAASSSSPADEAAVSATVVGKDNGLYSVLRPAADVMAQADTLADSKANARLRLLNDVHRALAAPISRADLLHMLLEHAFAVLQPEQAAIFTRAPGGGLECAASKRSGEASGPMLVSTRLAHEVTVKGSAALVLDAQTDERFASAMSVVTLGVRSILAAPLSDAEGCLGMIALYSAVHARRFSEQDLEVLVSIASAAAMRLRNIQMAEAAAERLAVDREIAWAHDVQMDLLRRRPPERREVELAGCVVPARSVGGDFFDFLLVGDRLWFVVADVSGKGIGAALMMAVGQTLFRALAASGASLEDVLVRMNRELAADNDRAMFITALAGWLDLSDGRLQLANAGHNLPYAIRRDGSICVPPLPNNIALGVLEAVNYPVTEMRLAQGDAILLYTDGVSDAIDSSGGRFGVAGLERSLREAGAASADLLVERVCSAVSAFSGSVPQEDDITVAVVRYRGSDEGLMAAASRPVPAPSRR